MDGDLLLRHTTRDNGRAVITAFAGEDAIFTDQIDVADAGVREAFVQELVRRCPGVDVDQLRKEMERVAAEVGAEFKKQTQAKLLVGLASVAELFHAPGADGQAYAVVPDGEQREVMAVRSAAFRQWLRHEFWMVYEDVPSSQAVASAVETVAGKAVFEGPMHPVWEGLRSTSVPPTSTWRMTSAAWWRSTPRAGGS